MDTNPNINSLGGTTMNGSNIERIKSAIYAAPSYEETLNVFHEACEGCMSVECIHEGCPIAAAFARKALLYPEFKERTKKELYD